MQRQTPAAVAGLAAVVLLRIRTAGQRLFPGGKQDSHPDSACFSAQHEQPAQKRLKDRTAYTGKDVWFPYQTKFHPLIKRKMGASSLPVNWDENLAWDVTTNNKSWIPWKTHLRRSLAPSPFPAGQARPPPAPRGAAAPGMSPWRGTSSLPQSEGLMQPGSTNGVKVCPGPLPRWVTLQWSTNRFGT